MHGSFFLAPARALFAHCLVRRRFLGYNMRWHPHASLHEGVIACNKLFTEVFMYIIVGLGNPGREYADTRHNMGFMALDILAARHNIDIRKENFRSVYGEGRIGTERVILAKPLTFMNNSGWAVRDLVNWFKIKHDQLIVIYDDIDLDPGDLRIREKGSSGSHNGMKSVIYQLGFDDFPRIRVGVGAPEGGRDLIAHVMSMPTGEALDKVKAALNDAADAAELMVSGRIADAQMRFNKKPKRKKKEEAKKAEAENAEQKGETKDE